MIKFGSRLLYTLYGPEYFKTKYIALISNLKYIPAAGTVNPAVTNVYAVEEHVINCNFSDIPSQIYGVKWSPHTMKTDGYTLKDGIFDQEKKFQVSTLTISSIELIELKGSAESHIFTCEITVGSNDRSVAASQTINIFNPSRGAVFPLFGHT